MLKLLTCIYRIYKYNKHYHSIDFNHYACYCLKMEIILFNTFMCYFEFKLIFIYKIFLYLHKF